MTGSHLNVHSAGILTSPELEEAPCPSAGEQRSHRDRFCEHAADGRSTVEEAHRRPAGRQSRHEASL